MLLEPRAPQSHHLTRTYPVWICTFRTFCAAREKPLTSWPLRGVRSPVSAGHKHLLLARA